MKRRSHPTVDKRKSQRVILTATNDFAKCQSFKNLTNQTQKHQFTVKLESEY